MDNQNQPRPAMSDITPARPATAAPAPQSADNQPPVVPPSPLSTAPEDPAPKRERGEGFRELMSTHGILLGALIIAGMLISFVFQSYEVDGPSMETTLQNHDRLIVWKVPRTIARITHHDYVPHRGDVMIFVESGLAEYGQDDTKQLIKRVIGLPGERIVVKDGNITVYNKEHPDGFDPDKTMSYGKVIPTTPGDIDVTLGPNQLFMCGDNRPNSLDSRAFGPINTNQIVGKLVFRLLPISKAETF